MTKKRVQNDKNKKRLLISILLVLFIAFCGYCLVNNQFIKSLYYKYNDPVSENNTVINLSDSSTPKFLTFKNLLIKYSGNNISAYDIKGENVDFNKYSEITALTSHYTNLNIKSCDNYIIAYDKGSTNLVLFNNDKIITQLSEKSNIIFAKPFNNGEFIVIAEDDDAKNQVILYSSDGNQKFIWHSGVNNIVDAAFMDKTNKLVIITTELSTGVLNSKIIFFDIGSEAPYSETIFENTFFTNVNFYSKNKLVVLSDMGTYYFNDSGQHKHTYSFDNKMLNSYKKINNGNMAFVFGSQSGNGSVVEVINKDGKLLGRYETEEAIISIDATKNHILLSGLRDVTLLTKRGRVIRTIEYNKDLQQAFFLNNKFVFIANSEIRIVD
ncbi:MAG: hypothetical protein E7405_02135 [Ruminococcaceae bacterium]|nr:hypothetical protein [Oscillospiraceae bacterium]